jgi:hypothetical protein
VLSWADDGFQDEGASQLPITSGFRHESESDL